MVDFGPEQGLSEFETAVVVRLLRGFQMSENAALGQKMPFMDGHCRMKKAPPVFGRAFLNFVSADDGHLQRVA